LNLKAFCLGLCFEIIQPKKESKKMKNPLTEAQTSDTSHARLRELAENSSLWMVLLSNPNTPIELAATLRKKIAGHPKPNELDAHTLDLMIKEASEQSDPERLQWLSQYGGDVARAVARNPNINTKLVTELSAHRDILVVCELLRNPSLNAENLPMLRAGGVNHHVARAVAASSKAQPELLCGLLKNSNRKLVQSIAQNKSLPLYGMISLWLERKSWAVRLYERECATDERAQTLAPWLGKLKNIARLNVWRFPAVVAELQKNEMCDPGLRETLFEVSRIPNFYATEEDFKRLLAGDKSVIALQLTAGYYSTAAYLATQVNHESPRVRAQVASNYRTSVEDLETLASDPVFAVRFNTARNSRTGPIGLQKLSTAAEKEIRLVVAQHFQTPPEAMRLLAQDQDKAVRIASARNPQTPADALCELAKEDNLEIQMAVLNNPKFPAAKRRIFVNSRNEAVRIQLAVVGSLEAAVYNLLCKDASEKVRKALCANPYINAEQLALLINDASASIRASIASHPRMTSELLAVLAKDELVKVRIAVAERYRANVDTLSSLARDNSYYVRLAVAKNTKTRKSTLQKLSSDPNERVKKAAQQRLQEKESAARA
jgi:hypothetical protein